MLTEDVKNRSAYDWLSTMLFSDWLFADSDLLIDVCCPPADLDGSDEQSSEGLDGVEEFFSGEAAAVFTQVDGQI